MTPASPSRVSCLRRKTGFSRNGPGFSRRFRRSIPSYAPPGPQRCWPSPRLPRSSESTNLDLGVSYARGHNNAGVGTAFDPSRFLTNLYSADATLRWKPLRRAIYHSFLFRNEFFWSARDQVSPAAFFPDSACLWPLFRCRIRANRRWTIGAALTAAAMPPTQI